jgi:hypothetical protein
MWQVFLQPLLWIWEDGERRSKMEQSSKTRLCWAIAGLGAIAMAITRKWWGPLILALWPWLASSALRTGMSEGGAAMNRIRWHG